MSRRRKRKAPPVLRGYVAATCVVALLAMTGTLAYQTYRVVQLQHQLEMANMVVRACAEAIQAIPNPNLN